MDYSKYDIASINDILTMASNSGYTLTCDSSYDLDRCLPYGTLKEVNGGGVFTSTANSAKPKCVVYTKGDNRYIPSGSTSVLISSGYTDTNLVQLESMLLEDYYTVLAIAFNDVTPNAEPIAKVDKVSFLGQTGTDVNTTVTGDTMELQFVSAIPTSTVLNMNNVSVKLKKTFKLSDGKFNVNANEPFTITYTDFDSGSTKSKDSETHYNEQCVSLSPNNFSSFKLSGVKPTTYTGTTMSYRLRYSNASGDTATSLLRFNNNKNSSPFYYLSKVSVKTTTKIVSTLIHINFNLELRIEYRNSNNTTLYIDKIPKIVIQTYDGTTRTVLLEDTFSTSDNLVYTYSLNMPIDVSTSETIEVYILNYVYKYRPTSTSVNNPITASWSVGRYTSTLNGSPTFSIPFSDLASGQSDKGYTNDTSFKAYLSPDRVQPIYETGVPISHPISYYNYNITGRGNNTYKLKFYLGNIKEAPSIDGGGGDIGGGQVHPIDPSGSTSGVTGEIVT